MKQVRTKVVSMFEEVTATKRSLSLRSLVLGVGFNDATYNVTNRVGGKNYRCPTYAAWLGMLERAYSVSYQEKYPTYKRVTVGTEWLLFSNFYKWYKSNYVEGWHLDKDLKEVGNLCYRESTCLYIPPDLNLLSFSQDRVEGQLSKGVYLYKGTECYTASCAGNYLGRFKSEAEASAAYKTEKNRSIVAAAIRYPHLAKYILKHVYLDM